MNSKISELNTNAVAGEGVNVAVDGGDVQSENYLRGYNTLHYVNISPADTRFERGMSDLGRRMPDLGRRMPDFEIVQNLQPTRRYRIKRQQPGCCSRCNAQYGGACDPGKPVPIFQTEPSLY